MSSHLSKKDLKKDPLVAAEIGVEHYVAGHKSQVTKIVGGVAAVAVLAGGYWLYSNRQASARQEALREARRAVTGVVGGQATGSTLSFPTQADQDKAVQESFSKLAEQYPGTTEGAIARLYLAGKALDLGETDKAVQYYREVADNAPEQFESSAKLSLAQVLWGQGKTEEGRKLLEDLIAHPTSFVSAEHANLTLARLELKTNPEDARQRLEQLRTSGTAVSTLAVELMTLLPQ